MAVPLTPGKIYVLDWPPAGNDPDNYDLDDGTESADYVSADIPLQFYNYIDLLKESSVKPGEFTLIITKDKYADSVSFKALINQTTPTLMTVDQGYWTDFYHNKIDDDGDLYLVFYFGTNAHWQFFDTDAATIRGYCRGTIMKISPLRWDQQKPFTIELNITWIAFWG